MSPAFAPGIHLFGNLKIRIAEHAA